MKKRQIWRSLVVVTTLIGTLGLGAPGALAGQHGSLPAPSLIYAGPHGLQLRAGAGPARTLSPTNVSALAWSSDGTKVGWITGDQHIDLLTLAGGPARSWKCATCDAVEFQGHTLVASSYAGKPHILRYPASGGAPASVPITGLPKTRFTENVFVLVSATPSGQVIAAYGTGVSASGGPADLYKIGVKGKATPFGSVKKQIVSNTIAHQFAYSASGSKLAFVLTGHGGICANSDFVVLANSSGAETAPPMPKGLIYVGNVWFSAAGTPMMSEVHAPTRCGSKNVTSAPKDYRLAGQRWVNAGFGTIDAAYREGWSAVQSGRLISSPLGLQGLSAPALTVSHGSTHYTVKGVVAFAWLP